MSETIYVEMPAGTAFPDGYIVQAEVVKRITGHTKVVLRPLPPYERHDWSVWVRNTNIIAPEDLE